MGIRGSSRTISGLERIAATLEKRDLLRKGDLSASRLFAVTDHGSAIRLDRINAIKVRQTSLISFS